MNNFVSIEKWMELEEENAHLQRRVDQLDDVLVRMNQDMDKMARKLVWLENKLDELAPAENALHDQAPNGWNR